MSSSTSLNAPITTVNKNNSITNIKDITVGRNLSTSSIENNSYTTLNAKSSPVFSNACNRSLIQFNVYNQLQQLQQQNFQTISTPSSPLNTGFSPNTVLKNADDDIFQTTTPEIKSPKTNLIDMVRLSSAGSREFNKSTKKESLKEQKKNYRCEKKRATNEILSTLADPNVMMISDWLKVRGSLKSWVKLWCVLKPGLLLLYKSTKNKPRPKDGAKALKSNENVETSMITQSSHWVATCLLSSCEVMERPSKKDGFCFKLFHPLDQSIWATKGPKGENIGALTLPLPNSYLICRASSEAAGRCWIDALELALHCTGLLLRSMTNKEANLADLQTRQGAEGRESSGPYAVCENDFDPSLELDDKEVLKFESEEEEEEEDEEDECSKLKKGKSKISSEFKRKTDHNSPPVESPYIENVVEELGQTGSACQTEEVADENRSIIWTLVKQVRPGMDLSKVALPTFILEPRSFLDKLSDYYYHADLLSEAVCLEDPYSRMKMVVKWYLSGFYKKPKGLKKPYNPILGETFRCYWKHPKTSSRTFYIAEQISHHPPVSAFYVTNRQDGFSITGSIFAKSKFYGNSLSAFLDGVCRLVLLSRGEEYTITMPYAHCKGILIGTLTMEFGGEVSIQCEKTGYKTELEFKLKPFLGSDEASNRVAGKIKLGEETLASIEGHWDQETYIRDKKTQNSYLFWNPNTDVKSARLKRHTISPECQFDFESEKLWKHVSEAITKGDQRAATDEKCLLEEEQRKNARERKARMLEWTPNLFERNLITGDWVYKFADWRPWDPLNDVLQFEKDFVISTKTNHQTPIVHTTSITSMEDNPLSPKISGNHSRNPSMDCAVRMQRMKIRSINIPSGTEGSPLGDNNADDADSGSSSSAQVDEVEKYEKKQNVTIDCLLDLQKEMNEKVNHVQHQLTVLHSKLSASRDNHFHKTIAIVIATIIMHYLILSLFK